MKNGVAEKSLNFAVSIVKLYKVLTTSHKEFVMSKQLLRSGTAVGALIREAEHGESRADFIHKMSIVLKEANERLYWLILLQKTEYLLNQQYESIHKDCDEIVRMLVSIVKSSKKNK